MDHLRRILFALAVFIVSLLIFAVWRQGREGYGLMNLLRGDKPGTESFTTSPAPKLNLEDVQVLAAMNEEFAKLSAAVVPSVVSVTTKTLRRGQTAWHPFFGIVTGRPQVIPGL